MTISAQTPLAGPRRHTPTNVQSVILAIMIGTPTQVTDYFAIIL